MFGLLLQRAAQKHRTSLEGIAREAGVSKQFVHNLMHGKTNTGLAKALKVAQSVGLIMYSHRRPERREMQRKYPPAELAKHYPWAFPAHRPRMEVASDCRVDGAADDPGET